MKKINLKIVKSLLVVSGLASIFLSFFLVAVSAEVRIMAQCGSDSYVECQGYSCSATDDVGCTCHNQAGRVTSRHSCAYASPGGGGMEEMEDPPVS
jgi:hypothetical protein